MNIIGKLCSARYCGVYVHGTIRHHDVKRGLCTVETRKLGTVIVKSARVNLIDTDRDEKI